MLCRLLLVILFCAYARELLRDLSIHMGHLYSVYWGFAYMGMPHWPWGGFCIGSVAKSVLQEVNDY